MTLQDLLDPLLDASWKGYPHHAAPLRHKRWYSRYTQAHGALPVSIYEVFEAS